MCPAMRGRSIIGKKPALLPYHGWLVAAAAFLVALYGFGLGFYGPGIYLVALRALHGWTTRELSSAITTYYVLGATLLFFWVGPLFDRDHAMTAAGYRVTRWADDFVVVCRTHQEAQTARALAGSFLRNELGVSLHPEKTGIVHVDHGFEFLGYKVKRGKGLRLSASKRTSHANPHNLYAVPREKSVARFKDQIRNLTQRRAPVRLRDMIEVINPIIRGWGNYYRKANVRKLFHRRDGWIERRLWSFISKRWRNTAWRRYPSSRLIADFGLVRLIYLVPGIRPNLRQPARPT